MIAPLARASQALQSDKSVQCVRNPAPIENRVAAVQQCIVSPRPKDRKVWSGQVARHNTSELLEAAKNTW